MELMLNSCKMQEIEEVLSWGIAKGITMNPTMMARTGGDFIDTFKQIRATTDLPVFAQVVSTEPEEIFVQGLALAGLGENIVVKVHSSVQGIKGMRLLKQQGIKVCATAIHSQIEAIMVALAEVDYAAVFVGLLAEVDENDSNQLMNSIQCIYKQNGFRTKIMAAVRSVNQLVTAATIGVDAVTCAYNLWPHFLNNNYTANRWSAFLGDWQQAFGDRTWTT